MGAGILRESSSQSRIREVEDPETFHAIVNPKVRDLVRHDGLRHETRFFASAQNDTLSRSRYSEGFAGEWCCCVGSKSRPGEELIDIRRGMNGNRRIPLTGPPILHEHSADQGVDDIARVLV